MKRKSQVEEIICQTLLEMIKQSPLSTIKVTTLVKEANISRSSFYIYFSSIDDVIQKIEDDFLEKLDNSETIKLEDFKSGNSQKVLNVLHVIQKNMEIYRLLSSDNGDPYFQYRLANRSLKILETITQNIPTKLSSAEKRLLMEQITGGRWQMYKWWSQNTEIISIEEVNHMTQKLIVQFFNLLEE